jgi:hypothetical protein
MYRFKCSVPCLTVMLHDAAGQPCGKVKFNSGQYNTSDPDEATAIERAAAGMTEFRIVCVSRPEPEATPADAEPAAEQPEPAPVTHRHRRRT